MIKKILPIILCLCLLFSISAMAANTNDNNVPAKSSQEMPMQGGERPQGGNRGGQMPQGEFTPPQNNMTNNDESTAPQENNALENENTQAANNNPENNTQKPNESPEQNGQQNGQFPGGMQGGFPGEMQNGNQTTEAQQSTGFIGFVKTYSTPITSVILLALAFVFVLFYKKRSY